MSEYNRLRHSARTWTASIAIALAACSPASTAGVKPTPVIPDAPRPPDCASTTTSLPFPPAFPPDLRLPKGTVVTAVEPFPPSIETRGYYVRGYASLGFADLAQYLTTELPKAGYRIGRGESEAWEMEALFAGNNRNGAFRALAVGGCPNVSLFELAIVDPNP